MENFSFSITAFKSQQNQIWRCVQLEYSGKRKMRSQGVCFCDIHSWVLQLQSASFVSFAPVLPGRLCSQLKWVELELKGSIPAKNLGGFHNPSMPWHQLNKLSMLFLEWWLYLFDLFGTTDYIQNCVLKERFFCLAIFDVRWSKIKQRKRRRKSKVK